MHEVSVGVILVGVAVACLLILVWSGFRAIVHVTDVVKPEFLSIFLSVGVCQVIAHVQCAVKLQIALCQVLALRQSCRRSILWHLFRPHAASACRCGFYIFCCPCQRMAGRVFGSVFCVMLP